MREFRHQLDAAGDASGERYLLTANTSASPVAAAKLQLPQLAKVVDWFNVMTFEFYGAFEPNGPTDFASGLYQDPRDPYPAPFQFDTDKTVKFYESQGVCPDKIAIAVPYFARYWTGVAPGPNGDGLFQTTAVAGGNSMNYNQLVTQPGTRYFDAATDEPYIYDSPSGTFYTYDDPASIALRDQYIRQQDLRGVMVWSLDGDTSDGRLTAALGGGLGVSTERSDGQ
jgi:chitinase